MAHLYTLHEDGICTPACPEYECMEGCGCSADPSLRGIKQRVTATAGDGVPAEIEYLDSKGEVVGFWAYGSWHPDYPYKGD